MITGDPAYVRELHPTEAVGEYMLKARQLVGCYAMLSASQRRSVVAAFDTTADEVIQLRAQVAQRDQEITKRAARNRELRDDADKLLALGEAIAAERDRLCADLDDAWAVLVHAGNSSLAGAIRTLIADRDQARTELRVATGQPGPRPGPAPAGDGPWWFRSLADAIQVPEEDTHRARPDLLAVAREHAREAEATYPFVPDYTEADLGEPVPHPDTVELYRMARESFRLPYVPGYDDEDDDEDQADEPQGGHPLWPVPCRHCRCNGAAHPIGPDLAPTGGPCLTCWKCKGYEPDQPGEVDHAVRTEVVGFTDYGSTIRITAGPPADDLHLIAVLGED